MQILEQIDQETCCFKVKALRSAVVSEEEAHCRNCSKEYELECERYRPMSRVEFGYRKGYHAVLSNQIKEESFNDMFTIHSGGFI